MQEEIDEMSKELDDVKATLNKKIKDLGTPDSDSVEDDERKNDVSDEDHSSCSYSINGNIDI